MTVMRIAVLSDTHTSSVDRIPAKTLEALAGADVIVHAGDFTERAVLDGLRAKGEVRAVHGNMDSAELKRLLPDRELFVLNGKRVGLTHGWGPPWGLAGRVRKLFGDVDLVIFGHSHVPWNQTVGGTLLFNPGSAKGTYGLISIEDEIRAEVVPV
jgi:putative phosphoesterase